MPDSYHTVIRIEHRKLRGFPLGEDLIQALGPTEVGVMGGGIDGGCAAC